MLEKLIEGKKQELKEHIDKSPTIDKFTMGKEWQANYKGTVNARYAIELAENLIEVLNR